MGGESLLPSASMPRLTWRQSFWAHEVQVRQAVALSTFFCTHYMAQYYHNHIDPATVVAAQYATNLVCLAAPFMAARRSTKPIVAQANLLSSNFIVWEMFRVISLSKDVDRLRCGLDRLWLCHYNINSVGFNTNPCELKTSPILTKIELAGAQSDYLQMARMIDTHGTARAFKNCMDILLTVQIVFLSPLSIVVLLYPSVA